MQDIWNEYAGFVVFFAWMAFTGWLALKPYPCKGEPHTPDHKTLHWSKDTPARVVYTCVKCGFEIEEPTARFNRIETDQ
jgi:hypothetical protein